VQDYCWEHWRSVAVKAISEPEIYNGAEFLLRADVRIRVQETLRIFMASRARKDDKRLKRKNAFGPILNLHFLHGWRLRHQAKSVTNNLPISSVLGGAIYLLKYWKC
jgi:hypothetical protein